MPARRQSLIEARSRRVVDPGSDRVTATRTHLLDAAEQLFLEQDPTTVSVRMINAAAGLNPGAVHYQFGSKHGLVLALLEDRLTKRLHVRDQLDRLEAADDVDMREIVELAVGPIVRLAHGTSRERLWVQLLVDAVRRDPESTFADAAFSPERWTALATRARPDLPARVVRRRWGYAVALLLAVAGTAGDRAGLVDFLVAGLSTPSPHA